MPPAGPPAPIRLRGALLGLALALPALGALRGFTVDDAWIPARYALHLASGLGLRFNAIDPPSDGVTPLPWTPLLALARPIVDRLGDPGIVGLWHAARAIGVASWLAAAARLGHHVGSLDRGPTRWLALLPIALSAPLAAWAWGGLETGLTTLLVTLAATSSGWPAALAVGLAASLRPEAIVLAVSLAALRPARSPAVRLAHALLAAAPWLAVVTVRLIAFGRPYPLSVLAKPSDLSHGLSYVLAGLLLAGAPALVLAPRSLLRSDATTRALLAAACLHAAAVAWAGGDWMPLSRLLVPSLPLWMVAAARLVAGTEAASVHRPPPTPPSLRSGGDHWRTSTSVERSASMDGVRRPVRRAGDDWRNDAGDDPLLSEAKGGSGGACASSPSLLWPLLRAVLATLGMLFVWWRVGAAAREVVPVRDALLAQARPALAPCRSVATLDAGWVGAATDARVVDLAGLTDLAIASLPGGHTSKRITGAMLDRREVDTLILLRRRGLPVDQVRDDGGPYDRQVEERLAADPWVQAHLHPGPVLAAGDLVYVVWR